LQRIVEQPQAPMVVVVSADSSITTAVQATRLGASGYLEKPFTPCDLRNALAKAQSAVGSPETFKRTPDRDPRGKVQADGPPLRFTSDDPRTRDEIDILFRAAATPASILLLGESGTGKSVIAREIHRRSHLRDKPFQTVSCPSLSKELLESALFGHVKGSFTGAIKDTWGKIHEADGGTLFLDEIGELPVEIQPKLLRFLQEREYERLGENKVREANVRIIAATNRDLKASMETGDFREDLYYRLNVISVTIPPLRDRRADLEVFADAFLTFFAQKVGRRISGFTKCGRDALMSYPWPGNLRELRNAIERATILASGPSITADDLPTTTGSAPDPRIVELGSPRIGGEHSLDEIEQAHMVKVLSWAASFNDAAQVLGIDKATLYRKRKRLLAEARSR